MTGVPDPLAQLERMLAEATPRPWAYGINYWAVPVPAILTSDENGKLIAELGIIDDLPAEVNGALIITLVNAAPHLIAVAKAAEAHNRHSKAEHCPTCKQLRDALAGLRAHLGETP